MQNNRFSKEYTFAAARPVWIKGAERELNVSADFTAIIHGPKATLAVAGASSFIVLVNGAFFAFGPSRRAHGYYDVDEYDLSGVLHEGENVLCVRLAGYHVNAFSTLDVMPFLCAEIHEDGKLTAYTAPVGGGFAVTTLSERVSRVPRYSFQRPFIEVYRLAPGAFRAEHEMPQTSDVALFDLTEREGAAAMTFLCRTVPYGTYPILKPTAMLRRGKLSTSPKEKYFSDRCVREISYKLKGYTENTLEVPTHIEYGKLDFAAPVDASGESPDVISLPHNSYADLTFERDVAGIFEMDIEGNGGKLYIGTIELQINGEITPLWRDTLSVSEIILQPGSYHVTFAEPYVGKFVRLAVLGGPVTVSNFRMRKVAFPLETVPVKYTGNDDVLRDIYDAARETFAANASDIFMDCPGRERAGWLCDSFFTARTEYALTGESRVETSFLENFLLPKSFDCLPDGMLPMCYPGDHYDHGFICNWAMWYVLELNEYIRKRHGNPLIAEMARERLYDLLKFFRRYENGEGLLEKLPGWVFVEWSHCNDLVQDINYPTNMVYAAMKDALADLYGDDALRTEAEHIREVVRNEAMTPSGFFCDNAVYDKNGVAKLTGERTETCQYYAFYFGVATPETYPDLWQTLLTDFGYDRAKTGKYPEISPSNAFIGNYLRLDLLARYGKHELLLDNIRGYFSYMAEQTGTLWEHTSPMASTCHGFASHVIVWLKEMGLVK